MVEITSLKEEEKYGVMQNSGNLNRKFPFGITSLENKKKLLQEGDEVVFSLGTCWLTQEKRAVKIVLEGTDTPEGPYLKGSPKLSPPIPGNQTGKTPPPTAL